MLAREHLDVYRTKEIGPGECLRGANRRHGHQNVSTAVVCSSTSTTTSTSTKGPRMPAGAIGGRSIDVCWSKSRLNPAHKGGDNRAVARERRAFSIRSRGIGLLVEKTPEPLSSLGSKSANEFLGSETSKALFGPEAAKALLGSEAAKALLGSEAAKALLRSEAAKALLRSEAAKAFLRVEPFQYLFRRQSLQTTLDRRRLDQGVPRLLNRCFHDILLVTYCETDAT